MARRFSNRRPIVSAKRGNVWIGVDISATVVGAGTKVLLGIYNAAALALRPFTVVRTRLIVHWSTDQFSATEKPVGAMGMIVVSDQATGIGATAVPDPISQSDAPFFVWEGLVSEFTFATAIGFSVRGGEVTVVDSKAMRMVGNNEDVAIVGTNTSSVGADIVVIGRQLVKLL